MKKKVLIIKGSPRIKGNTAQLAEAFAAGAEKAGHIVRFFDVNGHVADGCTACDQCWREGDRACIFDDGFNQFVEELMESDVFVIASPVYWGSFTARLKAYIDKMYAFMVPWCTKTMTKKQMVLLTCGDGPDESAFSMIRSQFEGLAELMEWEVIDCIAVPAMVEPDDIQGTDGLKRARVLGESI